VKLDLGITPILIQQISFAARDPEYTALGFGINEFSVRKSELFRSAIAASRRAGKLARTIIAWRLASERG